MSQPISNYLVGDIYAPSVPKPSLQQYDNYQIYSIACIGGKFEKALAFQVYNNKLIPVDFTSIVLQYS
jgi:hypothetical protein